MKYFVFFTFLIFFSFRNCQVPLTQDFELSQSDDNNGGGNQFGFSVALNALTGNTLIVGSNNCLVSTNGTSSASQGCAFVFNRNSGGWVLQQRLTANDGATNDRFGNSISLYGNTAIIGASQASSNRGAAYVFTLSGNTWSQVQKLTAGDGAANDYFGYSVSLYGNTAIVGAWGAIIGANDQQGAAYVFTLTGNTWNQVQKLTAGDGAAFDLFGIAVSLYGNTAIVGASDATVGANSYQGAVYVFTLSGNTWSQVQKLTATNGGSNDYFGTSVTLFGNTAVIGAYQATIGGNSAQGAAFVFALSGNTWSQVQRLTAGDGAADDYFGSSVSLYGNNAVIGAYYDGVGTNFQQGSAYLFTFNGTNWNQIHKLISSNGAASDYFGYSVSLYGNTTVVGAYQVDFNGKANQGAAYVYDFFKPPPPQTTALQQTTSLQTTSVPLQTTGSSSVTSSSLKCSVPSIYVIFVLLFIIFFFKI